MINSSNLNLESKQNSSDSKASFFSIGGGYSSSGGGKSVSGNLSFAEAISDRNWVDDQASIIGTNSVTINAGNNTDIIGAVIANAIINDSTLEGESESLILVGGQKRNYYPEGSTFLSLSHNGNKKEGITRATIGDGILNIGDNSDLSELNRDLEKSEELLSDKITGNLNISAEIDNRLFGALFGSKEARDSLGRLGIIGRRMLKTILIN